MASSTPHVHNSDTDGAAASLFSTYERQYATTSTTVSTGLRQLQASASVNPSRAADKVRQLESHLKEAEMTLQRMDMEARSATPQAASAALIKKVKDYRRDYQTLLMDVRKAGQREGIGGNDVAHRAELGLSGYKTEAQQQRDRLLTATDRLEQTGDRIREGRKQLLETEVRSCCMHSGGHSLAGIVRGLIRSLAHAELTRLPCSPNLGGGWARAGSSASAAVFYRTIPRVYRGDAGAYDGGGVAGGSDVQLVATAPINCRD